MHRGAKTCTGYFRLTNHINVDEMWIRPFLFIIQSMTSCSNRFVAIWVSCVTHQTLFDSERKEREFKKSKKRKTGIGLEETERVGKRKEWVGNDNTTKAVWDWWTRLDYTNIPYFNAELGTKKKEWNEEEALNRPGMFSCCCFNPYTVLHLIVFILALSLYPIAHSSPESYCIYSKINI